MRRSPLDRQVLADSGNRVRMIANRCSTSLSAAYGLYVHSGGPSVARWDDASTFSWPSPPVVVQTFTHPLRPLRGKRRSYLRAVREFGDRGAARCLRVWPRLSARLTSIPIGTGCHDQQMKFGEMLTTRR
jgi:hypothetical protein